MSRSEPETRNLITPEILLEAAGCLRTIAHPHRLHMIQMLLTSEYTVGELAKACGIPSHMASEHLGRMKDRGLLRSERRGRCIYYQIAADGLAGIIHCIETHFVPRG